MTFEALSNCFFFVRFFISPLPWPLCKPFEDTHLNAPARKVYSIWIKVHGVTLRPLKAHLIQSHQNWFCTNINFLALYHSLCGPSIYLSYTHCCPASHAYKRQHSDSIMMDKRDTNFVHCCLRSHLSVKIAPSLPLLGHPNHSICYITLWAFVKPHLMRQTFYGWVFLHFCTTPSTNTQKHPNNNIPPTTHRTQ